MIAVDTLLRFAVHHAFDAADQPSPQIWVVPVDARRLERHRLTLRSHAGGCLVAFDRSASGQPRFGLPPWIDLALVAADAHLDGITAWPAGASAPRPTGLLGVGRRALPFYSAELVGGGDAMVHPAPEPTWIARRIVSLEVPSDTPLATRLSDSAEEVVVVRIAEPDSGGRVRLTADLLGRTPDRWRLAVGETAHAVYAAPLPERTLAVVRIDLRRLDGVEVAPHDIRLGLDAAAHIWTWRIVPAASRPPGPVHYVIEHPSLAIGPGMPITLGARPAVAFSSAAPIPWRARPAGPFSLWSTTTDNQRHLLVERLPTPSPRALRPVVDVHL